MVKDAEANKADDERRKDQVETKNNAESLVYQTEKQMQELADKIPANLKASIDPKLNALQDAVKQPSPDTEMLKKMTKDLQEELMKIGQAAYAASGGAAAGGAPGGAPPPPPSGGPKQADVVDV